MLETFPLIDTAEEKLYWLVALVFSAFYGLRAIRILVYPYKDKFYFGGKLQLKVGIYEKLKEFIKEFFKGLFRLDFDLPSVPEKVKDKYVMIRYTKSWFLHQIWLNFISSISGWVALYYLAFIRLPLVLSTSDKKFGFEDGFVLLIALLGITGFLPYTLSKITSIYK